MHSITLSKYVADNRQRLSELIHAAVPNLPMSDIDEDEIADWVLNDEGLYQEAIAAGVDFDKDDD